MQDPQYYPYELLNGEYIRLTKRDLTPNPEAPVRGWIKLLKYVHDYEAIECAGIDCIMSGLHSMKLLCDYEDLEPSNQQIDDYFFDEDRIFENLFAIVLVCEQCEIESRNQDTFSIKDSPCIIDDCED